MRLRADLEADGAIALPRLIRVAGGDTGQSGRVRRFLLGLYNGDAFKFDLTELRSLDRNLQEDCMAVLAMDIDGPRVEVHERTAASAVIAKWAADAWPQEPSR